MTNLAKKSLPDKVKHLQNLIGKSFKIHTQDSTQIIIKTDNLTIQLLQDTIIILWEPLQKNQMQTYEK